jgi:hypothetical protein
MERARSESIFCWPRTRLPFVLLNEAFEERFVLDVLWDVLALGALAGALRRFVEDDFLCVELVERVVLAELVFCVEEAASSLAFARYTAAHSTTVPATSTDFAVRASRVPLLSTKPHAPGKQKAQRRLALIIVDARIIGQPCWAGVVTEVYRL